VLRLRDSAVYRCDALFDVADIRSERLLHADIPAVMRDEMRAGLPAPRRGNLVAVLRPPGSRRSVRNHAELHGWLAARGATMLDLDRASFAAQVEAFATAETLVGDLGSHLAGLIYAGKRLNVLTLGPLGWHDPYFARLAPMLAVRQADIRGVPERVAPPAPGTSLFQVDIADVAAGLEALRPAKPAETPGRVWRDGVAYARSLGPAVLVVNFGEHGNAALFKLAGWGGSLGDATWSIGPRAVLTFFGLELPTQDYWLEIDAVAYVAPPDFSTRTLTVTVNGKRADRRVVAGQMRLHILLPAAMIEDSTWLNIEIDHPPVPSLHALGRGADKRPLGLQWRRMRLLAASGGGG
jgi:hypothetical protein